MDGTIDPDDLRLFKASEMLIGGFFYLKTGDKFETCCINSHDLRSGRINGLRRLTKQYSTEGRLFVRISKPWQSFIT